MKVSSDDGDEDNEYGHPDRLKLATGRGRKAEFIVLARRLRTKVRGERPTPEKPSGSPPPYCTWLRL
jgi:hypothetical protein